MFAGEPDSKVRKNNVETSDKLVTIQHFTVFNNLKARPNIHTVSETCTEATNINSSPPFSYSRP